MKVKMPVLKDQTKYLGFVTGGEEIKPNLDKVEVLREMPEPIG